MNEWEWQLLEDKVKVDRLDVDGVEFRVDDRVRLKPRPGGDIMDLALTGQTAMVEAIEQDYEGKHHVCVVLDIDPGRDMGLLRQPGHRFFFDPAEIEFVSRDEKKAQSARPTILIAGIGNIFLGDDGFGVEVVRRLLESGVPDGVRVADFGIRGLDLAYALQDEYETVILVDAFSQQQPPGTVFLVEPDFDSVMSAGAPVVEAHAMDPVSVLQMASGMGARPGKVLLVGCEPCSLGGEDGHMGLSAPVASAVDQAVRRIEELLFQLLRKSS
ncbi:MAG TPA: hydrogenase maturation protease [Candidatus Sulfotelmatobacter sp.]|nr:hydrogenase maturation protease [Candidatus Sulfotelmatobacter sp.]